MSETIIPFQVKPHPVTGIPNGKFGMWLFLASEIMLFGALFSAYIVLRVGAAPGTWPVGYEATHLSVTIGAINTFILITSSVTVVLAWAALKMGQLGRARLYILATILCAIAFLIIKLKFEYFHKFHMDPPLLPKSSTFYACYYLITGLHGLHVIGGIIAFGMLLGLSGKQWAQNPEFFTNRIENAGLYWHFVDLVWIFLFPTFYLL